MKDRKTILILVLTLILISFFVVIFKIGEKTKEQNLEVQNSDYEKPLVIENQTIFIDEAKTQSERTRGLSGQSGLEKNQGLLFIFDKSDFHGIWMKEMLFAIDILWLSETGKVIFIKENALPESYPEVFIPKSKARFVLELPSGSVEDFGIKVGSVVTF